MLEPAFAWVQVGDVLGLGRDAGDVGAIQMAVRTIVVYVVALAVVRIGSKRFLSQASAFDVIVAIMLGSIMSRAINGSAAFVPTLLSGAVLVAMHWLLAALAYRLDWLGPLVKGRPALLVRDGHIDREAMREAGVSDHDLEQALRLQARRMDLNRIHLAYLERDGSISVIPAEREPAVLDIRVEDGVQTVRVRME
jgi:uncharacterized membrane protein YcaP (DUF421 family)